MKERKQFYEQNSGESRFSMIISSEWNEDYDGNILGLYKDMEKGVINISTYKKNNPTVLSQDPKKVLEMALVGIVGDGYNKKIPIKMYSKTDCKFALCEFVARDTFWKTMYVAGKIRSAYVTYNCDEKNRKKDIEEVDKIFDSFELG